MRQPDTNFSKFIEKYVTNDTPKVLIECGANNGIGGSIGFYYERNHNWQTINIEANKYSYDMLAIKRPHSLNLHAGLSDKDEILELIFPIDGPRGLFTGNGSFRRTEEDWKKEKRNNKHRKVQSHSVKCRRLDDIVNEYEIKEVGIFILDVEGFEEKVLAGMSKMPSSSLPKIMVIENDKADMKEAKTLLSLLGPYSHVDNWKNNSIFLYNREK